MLLMAPSSRWLCSSICFLLRRSDQAPIIQIPNTTAATAAIAIDNDVGESAFGSI